MTIQLALGLYLVIGIVALVLLDLITGRIRRRFKNASVEAQEKMVAKGSYVGNKQVMILTTFALLVFWPFVRQEQPCSLMVWMIMLIFQGI